MKRSITTIFKTDSSQRGIALLMVLASLVMLSSLVVEFAYNSNVTYNLALNEKDRLQAFYLAQSGVSFAELVIKYDKDAKKMAEQASKKLGKSIQIQPLYEMIPINTGMIRGLAGLEEGGAPGAGEGGTEAAGKPPAEGQADGEGAAKNEVGDAVFSTIDTKGAESFLAFEGDFSAEVSEEESKLNLNAFYGLTPSQKTYDRLKGTLYHLLATDEFKGFFDDRYRGAKDLAQNIVDYIDRDDAQNEAGGQERGREGIGSGKAVKMKNAKLLSLEELIMVPGVTDPILQKLKNYVTIYGQDEKIYVCRAQEPLVRALILAYAESNPNKMEPLRDDNEELIKKALDAVLNSCPDTQAMASDLDKALGATAPESEPSGGTTESGPTATATGPTSKSGTKPPASQGDTFTNMVKSDATFFTINSTGTVGESEVKVKKVLDTSSGNPRQWKELYWRVE